MKHTYKVTGMTCSGCQAKVQVLLSKVENVKNVAIDLSKSEATIEMEKHVPTSELQLALKDYPKYQLTELNGHPHTISIQKPPVILGDEKVSWIQTYKPILLVFAYILAVTSLVEVANQGFVLMRWMNHFMAGFFLVFSFFKFLNLKGFAESYAMYDIIAKKWNAWGYIYAFTELALGIAFITGFNPLLTNAVTLGVMTVSIIGVLQSVLNKRKIRCVCLGAVFNLPMSTITIIEDAAMIGMSGMMLITLL
jgi:copper chaperone CopZ/uncharacterized membrane protein YphA (DoxX/SURF4 family)